MVLLVSLQCVQGNLAHMKHRPSRDHHRSLGVGLLQGVTEGGGAFERGTLVLLKDVIHPQAYRSPSFCSAENKIYPFKKLNNHQSTFHSKRVILPQLVYGISLARFVKNQHLFPI